MLEFRELIDSFRNLLDVIFSFSKEKMQQTNSSSLIGETFCTVISGVIVYVLGQYIKEIWLDRLQEYKSIKAKIAKALVYYANYYSNLHVGVAPNEKYEKASDEIRQLASELTAFAETIYWLRLGIPKPKILKEASSNLIGLSNRFYAPTQDSVLRYIEYNDRAATEVRRLLNLKK